MSITPGRYQKPLTEALGHYLEFDIALPQNLARLPASWDPIFSEAPRGHHLKVIHLL